MMIIYILLFIYLAEPALCQGETLVSHGENLESLKTCLESNMLEYQRANEDHKQWSSIVRQVTKSPSARVLAELSGLTKFEFNRLYDLDDKLHVRIGKSYTFLSDCTTRMRATEAMIRILDPSFVSSIEKQWFEEIHKLRS